MIVKIPFLSWIGKAALEVEIPDGTEERFRLKVAVELSVGKRADLRGAYLYGADLYGADLYGAYLYGADLRGADLYGADLRGADLRGADLSGADLRGADLGGAYLRGADLGGAYLSGANLGGKKILGDRPVLILGPLGTDSRYLTAYLTDGGVMVQTGCFFDTLNQFAVRVGEVHGKSNHGREYRAVIALIEAHAAIWMPATEAKEAA